MPYMYRDKIRLSYLDNNIVPRDYCNVDNIVFISTLRGG